MAIENRGNPRTIQPTNMKRSHSIYTHAHAPNRSRGFKSPFPTMDEYLYFAEERGLIQYQVDSVGRAAF